MAATTLPAELAQAHYAQLASLTNAAAADAARRWSRVDPAAIFASWARQAPTMTAAVSAAQYAAAIGADPYVGAIATAEAGQLAVPEFALSAAAFAGVASDGRDLPTLMLQPAVVALQTIRQGNSTSQGLAAGYVSLEAIVRTQVVDAGREADLVANVTHHVDGYIRMTDGNACSRCIVLAGRWYRWSTGFLRHPRCECVMVPAPQGAEPPQNPKQLYDAMTPQERSDAGWSAAEQLAIEDGADIAAVTNIHGAGSLYTAGGKQYTRVGAGKRPRLTPRQIIADAHGNRDEAIRLLRLHRYIR